jgi:hypothetical protein
MYSRSNNPLGDAQLGAASSSSSMPHPRPAAASSPPPVSYTSAPVPPQIPAALGPVTGGFKPSYLMLNSTDRNAINGWASYERTIEAFLNRVRDTYPLPRPPFTPRSSAEVSKFWTKAEILILVYENEFGIFSPGNSKLKKPKGYHFASWVTLVSTSTPPLPPCLHLETDKYLLASASGNGDSTVPKTASTRSSVACTRRRMAGAG